MTTYIGRFVNGPKAGEHHAVMGGVTYEMSGIVVDDTGRHHLAVGRYDLVGWDDACEPPGLDYRWAGWRELELLEDDGELGILNRLTGRTPEPYSAINTEAAQLTIEIDRQFRAAMETRYCLPDHGTSADAGKGMLLEELLDQSTLDWLERVKAKKERG